MSGKDYESISGGGGSGVEESGATQIYRLSKPELVEILSEQTSLTALFESLSLDVLRKQLSKLLSQRKAGAKKSALSIEEKKAQQGASIGTLGESVEEGDRQAVVQVKPSIVADTGVPASVRTAMSNISKVGFSLGQTRQNVTRKRMANG